MDVLFKFFKELFSAESVSNWTEILEVVPRSIGIQSKKEVEALEVTGEFSTGS